MTKIADSLEELQEWEAAGKIHKTLNNMESLFDTFMQSQNWTEAFKMAENDSNLADKYYTSHAIFLIENERYLEAQQGWYNIIQSRQLKISFKIF